MSSDYGEVYIYVDEFFDVVAGLRERTGRTDGQASIDVPDVQHEDGTDALGSLVTAIDGARSAIAANFETAARILTAAATKVIEADMAEEGYSDWTLLATPGDVTNRQAPTDDMALYEDVYEYAEGDGPDAEGD